MKQPPSEISVGAAGWVQDQLYELKGEVGQLEQQFQQLQSIVTTLVEHTREIQVSLREALQGASQAPRLQEEVNQSVGLLVQLQDQQAEMKEKLDTLGRYREAEENRDQIEWADLARRTDQLERQVAAWQDRQAGVDEVGRRFQESLSLVRQQLLQIEQRLEAAESRSARALEGANRAEHTLTEVHAAIEALQREDEALIERSRASSEMVHRMESTLTQNLQELQRLELLAERIELHRAERQRLEDRALRLEEELSGLREASEKGEQQRGRLSTEQHGLASRLSALQEQVEEQRATLVEQIRKLIATQDRTKRRQIQELEREIRETKQYVADLTDR